MSVDTIPHRLNLRAGEWVVVRSRAEILQTLDAQGCLDNLPFMPEMLAFCNRRLRVYKRAHKSCDTVNYTGGRRMLNTVHLEDIRCDGASHGGCQAECLIFWKEAWLRRSEAAVTGPGDSPDCQGTVDVVERNVSHQDESTKERVYSCQATQMLKASTPLPWWDVRQFVEDYTSGNVGILRMISVFCYAGYNQLRALPWLGKWFRKLYNRTRRMLHQPPHPRSTGRIPPGAPTPKAKLDLQPGEWVRVKDFRSILETIDEKFKNRGLVWDAEMVPYCGGRYRVKKRVQRIINEKTGRMMEFKSDAIMLEGVVCQAKYSECRYFCPRSVYPYWREIWLEREAATQGELSASAPAQPAPGCPARGSIGKESDGQAAAGQISMLRQTDGRSE